MIRNDCVTVADLSSLILPHPPLHQYVRLQQKKSNSRLMNEPLLIFDSRSKYNSATNPLKRPCSSEECFNNESLGLPHSAAMSAPFQNSFLVIHMHAAIRRRSRRTEISLSNVSRSITRDRPLKWSANPRIRLSSEMLQCRLIDAGRQAVIDSFGVHHGTLRHGEPTIGQIS